MKIDCIGCGLIVLDHLCSAEHYPPPNSKNKLLDYRQQGGGPVPTALAVLARMGCSAALIGKTGYDLPGKFLQQELSEYGVNTDWLIQQSGLETAQAFIIVDGKHEERTVFLYRPDDLTLDPEEIEFDRLPDCRFVHLDGHDIETQIKLAKWAHEKGVTVSLDIGSARPVSKELLQRTDILIVSKEFAHFASPQTDLVAAAKELLKRWKCTLVGITLGEQGSVFASHKEVFTQKAFKVNAIDTTGAGDVFHGAFLYGLLKDMDYRQAARFSSAASALSCTTIGGKAGIPFETDVYKFLQTREPVSL